MVGLGNGALCKRGLKLQSVAAVAREMDKDRMLPYLRTLLSSSVGLRASAHAC